MRDPQPDNAISALWEQFARTRSQDDFARLYNATSQRVWAICLRITRDDEIASDAFQETYAALIYHAETPNTPTGSIDEWLLRIAVRTAGRLRQRQRRERPRNMPIEQAPEPHDTHPDPRATAANREARRNVEHALATLPEPERIALSLHLLDGFSHTEAAAALGQPRTTITSRIAKGLGRLRRELARRGIRNPDATLALAAAAGSAAIPARLSAAIVYTHARELLLAGWIPPAASTAPTVTTAIIGLAVMKQKTLILCGIILALCIGAAGVYTDPFGWRTASAPAPGIAGLRTGEDNTPPSPTLQTVHIAPQHDDSAPAPTITTTPTDDPLPIDTRLLITGRVLLPDGSPAPGATVVVQQSTFTDLTGDPRFVTDTTQLINTQLAETTTDDKGRFRLAAPRDLPVALEATLDGHAPAREYLAHGRVARRVNHEGIAQVDHTLRLGEGATVTGIVIDANERPLEGAEVSISFSEGAIYTMIQVNRRTGTDGRFRLDAPKGRMLHLRASHPEHGMEKRRIRSPDDIVVQLGVYDASISGTVFNTLTNQPVADANVSLYIRPASGEGGNPYGASIKSSPDGRFRFHHLPPGNFALTAEKDGWRHYTDAAPIMESLHLADSEHITDADLFLHPGFTLRGTVTDRYTNEPIPGARVIPASTLDLTHAGVYTDSDGRFLIQQIFGVVQKQGSGCRAALHAEKDGYGLPHMTEPVAVLMPGLDNIEQNITMTRVVQLSGVVRDPMGWPVPGAVAALSTPFGIQESWTTDHTGVYTLNAPARETVQVRAIAEGYAESYSHPVDVKDLDADGIDIVMDPGGHLVVEVHDPEGNTIPGAHVARLERFGREHLDSLSGFKQQSTDETGQVVYTSLPSTSAVKPFHWGVYQTTVSVWTSDHASPPEEEVEIRPNETTHVIITMREIPRENHHIAGRITNTKGEPLASAQVTAWWDTQSRTTTTHGDGTYRIEWLEPGTYGVRVSASDHAPQSRTGIEHNSDNVDFTLAPSRIRLYGLVIDTETGEPIPSFTALPADPAKQRIIRLPNTPGAFAVEGLRPNATLQLTITAPGYQTLHTQPHSAAGLNDDDILEFTLHRKDE